LRAHNEPGIENPPLVSTLLIFLVIQYSI